MCVCLTIILVFERELLVAFVFHLCFLGQNFLREPCDALELSFDGWAFRISVFDIVDDQVTVVTSSEQNLVIETKAHPRYRPLVRLDFIALN